MQRFIRHISWLALSFLLGTVLLILLPVKKEYAYRFINKAGCEGRSTWLYRQFFEDKAELDIVFVGTSHTMNAINDSLIANEWKQNFRSTVEVRNIAYCDFGRNLDYAFVKDLLEQKHPRILFLEIRENEAQVGHQQFAYIASGADVLAAPLWFNRSYFPDLYKMVLFRLQYLRECITHEDKQRITHLPDHRFGFNPAEGFADANTLRNEQNKSDVRGRDTSFIHDALDYAPTAYVEKIAALCHAKGVKLYLHYLPQYGYADFNYWQHGKYTHISPHIFSPDTGFFNTPEHWYDVGHLNADAANEYSIRLAKFLIGEEKKN